MWTTITGADLIIPSQPNPNDIRKCFLFWQARERMASTLTLLKSASIFGRDPTCDFRLDWDGCSRKHFTIHGQHPDGSGLPTVWLLVDEGTGTNNGVFVNGRRVSRATLRDGDIIGLGRGRDIQVCTLYAHLPTTPEYQCA